METLNEIECQESDKNFSSVDPIVNCENNQHDAVNWWKTSEKWVFGVFRLRQMTFRKLKYRFLPLALSKQVQVSKRYTQLLLGRYQIHTYHRSPSEFAKDFGLSRGEHIQHMKSMTKNKPKCFRNSLFLSLT